MGIKKYLTKILLSLLLLIFLFPLATYSQSVSIENPLRWNSFQDLINKIIDFLFYLAISVAPIMIIVAGFYFIGAGGVPEKIDTARKIILWTLIGLIIVFLAKGLIASLSAIFGITVP